jgi:uncharacterized protein (DUF4213/DUF364 family)
MKKDAKPAGGIVDSVLAAAANVADTDLIDVRVGQYWVGVRTGLGVGLASVLRSEAHLHGSRPISAAGELHTWAPIDLCSLLRSDSPPEGAIGLAAVNALVGPTARDLRDEKALQVLQKRGADRNVAMIGHFPFADRLREGCRELWIFERGIDRDEFDLGEEAMARLLPEADVVAITATTILNRTLPDVLAHVSADAFVMLLGPSTPLTPALFDFGFDVLCGTVVDDPEAVVRAVEQGAVTSQIPGVRRVCLWKDVGNQRKGAKAQRRKVC